MTGDEEPDKPKDEEYVIRDEPQSKPMPVIVIKPCCLGMVASVARYGGPLGIVDHLVTSSEGFGMFLEHIIANRKIVNMTGHMLSFVSEQTGVPFKDVNRRCVDAGAEFVNDCIMDKKMCNAEILGVAFAMMSVLSTTWREELEADRHAKKATGDEADRTGGPGSGGQ